MDWDLTCVILIKNLENLLVLLPIKFKFILVPIRDYSLNHIWGLRLWFGTRVLVLIGIIHSRLSIHPTGISSITY